MAGLLTAWLCFGMGLSFVSIIGDRYKKMKPMTVSDIAIAFLCGLCGPFAVRLLVKLKRIDNTHLF
jgi:H+/Cl- antiporter ClcA